MTDDRSSSSTIINKSQAFDEQMINSEKQRALRASTRKNGLIMIPPLMPRTRTNSVIKHEIKTVEESIVEEDIKGEEEEEIGVKKRKKMKSIDPKDMTEEQLIERRYMFMLFFHLQKRFFYIFETFA